LIIGTTVSPAGGLTMRSISGPDAVDRVTSLKIAASLNTGRYTIQRGIDKNLADRARKAQA
jgi:hypothetical protein